MRIRNGRFKSFLINVVFNHDIIHALNSRNGENYQDKVMHTNKSKHTCNVLTLVVLNKLKILHWSTHTVQE